MTTSENSSPPVSCETRAGASHHQVHHRAWFVVSGHPFRSPGYFDAIEEEEEEAIVPSPPAPARCTHPPTPYDSRDLPAFVGSNAAVSLIHVVVSRERRGDAMTM